jgi:phosphonate transport system substrate-binding protein
MFHGETLRFGIAPAVLTDETQEHLDRFCAAASRATGLHVVGTHTDSYEGLVAALEERTIDVAWLPPLVALQGIRRGLMLPLAIPVRHGSAMFRAVLFARCGSRIRGVDELKGCRAAWVDRESASGYAVIRAALRQKGVDFDVAFAEQRYLRSHHAVVGAVLEGRADVGATYVCYGIRGSIRAAGWSDVAEDAQFHIVAESEPIPNDLLAMGIGTSVLQAEALQRCLMDDAPGNDAAEEARSLFRAEGFAAPDPEHLAPLVSLLEE